MADWPYCWPWPTVRASVLERDGWLCQIRGPKCKRRATEVDHIIPWAEAPHLAYEPTNLRAACEPCNRGRGQQRKAALRRLDRQAAAAPSRDWTGQ